VLVLVLAAPDKFRGTLAAAEAARAIADGAGRAGWHCRELPLADGGEGTLDALGGANRVMRVSGPLGAPVEAAWRLEGGVAVIEAARASGLAVVGGAAANDPVAASTRGTGELIAAALGAGARAVVVGVGGSASTDGGLGAVEALGRRHFQVAVEVACDVRTPFLEAARVFGPQKGASPDQVALLSERLGRLAESYLDEFGLDVTALGGAGAAGGLAGGLAALGAELVAGFGLVAGRVGLEGALESADLVVTGEGKLDATSFDGKVVGGVLAACARRGIPALVVAGELEAGTPCPGASVSLVERYGRERALAEPARCIAEAVAGYLASWPDRRPAS
jgi:glycerate kinase